MEKKLKFILVADVKPVTRIYIRTLQNGIYTMEVTHPKREVEYYHSKRLQDFRDVINTHASYFKTIVTCDILAKVALSEMKIHPKVIYTIRGNE
jgi:hypothetical protein